MRLTSTAPKVVQMAAWDSLIVRRSWVALSVGMTTHPMQVWLIQGMEVVFVRLRTAYQRAW